MRIEDEAQFDHYAEVLDRLRERDLEKGSADSILLEELEEAIGKYGMEVQETKQMRDETRMLAEFIRKQTGTQFLPPFSIRSPDEMGRIDRWILKNILRESEHWLVLNKRGFNPFGTNGWFTTKENAVIFVNVMNELGKT